MEHNPGLRWQPSIQGPTTPQEKPKYPQTSAIWRIQGPIPRATLYDPRCHMLLALGCGRGRSTTRFTHTHTHILSHAQTLKHTLTNTHHNLNPCPHPMGYESPQMSYHTITSLEPATLHPMLGGKILQDENIMRT